MKAKKKLLMSVCALVFTVALATSATYAWFTMNDKVSVGSFDVNVTTGTEGLFVAYDRYVNTGTAEAPLWEVKKSDYGSMVDGTELKEVYQKAKTADSLADVGYTALSTKDGVNFGKKAAYGDGGTYTEPSYADALNGKVTANSKVDGENAASYISFNLYFRSTKPMNIYLNGDNIPDAIKTALGDDASRTKYTEVIPLGNPTGRTIKAWKSDAADMTYNRTKYLLADNANNADVAAADALLNARAANAARLSFVEGSDVKIWNPRAKNGYANGNMANDYNNFILDTSYAVPTLAQTALTKGDELLRVSDGTPQDGTEIATTALNATNNLYETTVTVNIWFEGWDGDCMNDIFSDKMLVALGFVGILVP